MKEYLYLQIYTHEGPSKYIQLQTLKTTCYIYIIKKMKKVAQEISGSVETFFERASRVHERYVRVLGENVTLKQKEDRRNKDKNKRKAEGRGTGN